MSNNTSTIFTIIDNLSFTSDEKTKLRIFFTERDATNMEGLLSIITKAEEKVEYLKEYIKPKGKPLFCNT